MSQTIAPDYSLTGVNAIAAVEKGLAEAEWYTTPVPKAEMRKLLERRNGPAIRDTVLLFGLLLATGYATFVLWGHWVGGVALSHLRGALRDEFGFTLA